MFQTIHMMRAVIRTELSPIVGSERQSEELVQSLLADFADDPARLWQCPTCLARALHQLVNEGLQAKLLHMPQEARTRMQETLGAGHQRGLHRPDLHPIVTRVAFRVYLKTPQHCSILPKSPICRVAFACIPPRSAALMRLASGAFWRISQHF